VAIDVGLTIVDFRLTILDCCSISVYREGILAKDETNLFFSPLAEASGN